MSAECIPTALVKLFICRGEVVAAAAPALWRLVSGSGGFMAVATSAHLAIQRLLVHPRIAHSQSGAPSRRAAQSDAAGRPGGRLGPQHAASDRWRRDTGRWFCSWPGEGAGGLQPAAGEPAFLLRALERAPGCPFRCPLRRSRDAPAIRCSPAAHRRRRLACRYRQGRRSLPLQTRPCPDMQSTCNPLRRRCWP